MSASDRWELDLDTAVTFLRQQDILPTAADARTRSLGGGVSNHVIQVQWDDRCLVLKQPLPNLAVEDDWPAAVERVHNEATAARAYRTVIAEGDLLAAVPAVEFESRQNHVIGIECAPASAVMWKRELLDGTVDQRIPPLLGALLAAVHERAADNAELREKFASQRPFEQLRLDPYHRTTARRHPDVAEAILAEADRVTAVNRTLVHGDYSPKNVLVDRDGDPVPWILDFEVAHWGDPAFDVAFMLNHLCIKSIYNHTHHAAYIDAARAFWTEYLSGSELAVESNVVAELGVLMLARVDGKSPVEYVEEGPIAEALRRSAKTILTESPGTIEGVFEILHKEVAR